MPPRKAISTPVPKQAVTVDNSDLESLNENTENTVKQNKQFSTVVKYNQNDSDRTQLAQAINNLTVKGDQFVEALGSFSKFKQSIVELDIQIESKKQEYKELNDKKDRDFSEKSNLLQKEYDEKKKQLNQTHTESVRALQNELKNIQIETEQNLRRFKLKACEDVAKELNMKLLNNDEYKLQVDTTAKVNKELDDLKKKFDATLNTVRQEEKTRFDTETKRQLEYKEQVYKTLTAEISAQLTQQKKEIEILNKTIETLKNEITEQRNLTKEIAQASSKSQISQTFAKN